MDIRPPMSKYYKYIFATSINENSATARIQAPIASITYYSNKYQGIVIGLVELLIFLFEV